MNATRTYKKHYPKGTSAATPTVLDGCFRLVTMPRLLTIMKRAFGRYHRWKRHATRRRPTLLRPLTVGERTVLRLRALADELASLLPPFRQTRPRGHEDLRGLLHDPDTRPAVVAQVKQLKACLDRVAPDHAQHSRQVEAWRKEWDRASPERRQQLGTVDKAHAIAAQMRAFYMLTEEAKTDVTYIEAMLPDAFTPPATTWPGNVTPPTQPATPTPYS